jgi:polyhydroxybutyrate depolymerase
MLNLKYMKNTFLLLLMLMAGAGAYAQLVSDSVLIENHYRTFHFNTPLLNTKNKSLVFVLHGSGGSGKQIMTGASRLEQLSSKENLLLVYPDGYKKFWNECRKAANSPANLENINEEAFFNYLIDYFVKRYHADVSNVFAVGTSGGGHMAYKLVLTMPEKIKAITAIVASLPDVTNMDCIEKKIARPVMIINGTQDPLNKWEGGEIILGNNISMGVMRSTDDTFRYWSQLAGYSGEPVKELLPDKDPSDGKTIERYSYRAKGKPEVVLLKVIGGKHDYPNDIDVYLEAWSFFKRQ